MASNKLSNLTGRIVPDFVSDDYAAFETFIKSYFEYLEQDLGEYDTVANLLNYRDIDETVDSFIEQFRYEKAPNLPPTAAASLRLLIKKVKLFYKVKGTESGFKFLYRSIFDSAVTFYYPRVDVLRTSDSTTILDEDKIVDSYYWQDFSYEIQSDVQKSAFYDKLIKDLVHPAGLKYFNRLSFDADIPAMPGITFVESLMVLIISSLNTLNVALSDSILNILLVKYTTQSLFHSTGYFDANKENEDLMGRLGFFDLGSMDELQLWQVEGRTGHAMGMLFTNGLKEPMTEYSVIDDELTMSERSAGERIDLVKIPKYTRNMFNSLTSDGSTNSIITEFVGTNKSNIFLFVNGFKQTQSDFSMAGTDLLSFGQVPLAGSLIEWHIVKHESELLIKADGVDTYNISKNIKNNDKYLYVFIKGRLQELDVDYELDINNNTITLLTSVTSNSVIDLAFVDKSSKDSFLTDGTAINTPYTKLRLSERLDAFNPVPATDIFYGVAP